jgi:Leucine-rich repeat (LRR) protein
LIPLALLTLISQPFYGQQTPKTVETQAVDITAEIDFDQNPIIKKNTFQRFAFDTYRIKHGLQIGTIATVGAPVVGKTVQLSNPVPAFIIAWRKDQQMLRSSGGDLLLTFEKPVNSVSIVCSRISKTTNVIRMMVVEPIENSSISVPATEIRRQVEVRVLAIAEKIDDSEDDSRYKLLLDCQGNSFQHVLLENATEQEAFQDLQFTRTKDRNDAKDELVAPIMNWERLARINGLDEQGITASWRGSNTYTHRNRISKLPKETLKLELKDSGFTDAEMLYVAGMKNLKQLGLGGTAISDEGLKALRDLSELNRLDLRASRVIDSSDVSVLSELNKLQEAGLRPMITDAGLQELSGLRQLRWLDLTDTQITDAGLLVLKELASLEELCLANTTVTTTGVRELLALEHLRHLDLWQTKVDDAVLIDLIKMKNLKHVVVGASVSLEGIDRAHSLRSDIAFSRIGPEYRDIEEVCLSIKSEKSRLKVFDDPTEKGSVTAEVVLTSPKTSDAMTRFIPYLRNLRSLDVTSTNISDAGLIEIGKQKSLRQLRLGGTHITDNGLLQLRDLSELKVLLLWGIRSDDLLTKDRGGGLPRGNVPRIRTLQTSGERPRITDAGLEHLKGLKNLETLDLFASQVTDAGLHHLVGLQNLRSLNLAHTLTTNEGIKVLAALSRLESLNLVGTGITDDGLLELKPLTSLRTVQVDAPITPMGVSRAKELMPNCKFSFPRRMNTGR